MRIYHSGERGNAQNTVYLHVVDVQNVEQLLQATSFDHVAAWYKDGHRSVADFIESDCLMLDIDNAPGKGQSDIPPSEWVDLNRIRADLPDVCFYAVPSKSHMKEKDGRPARPKYHLYFPIPLTTDAQKYKGIKEEVTARLTYFDRNAQDSARFFFGHTAPQAWFYEGGRLITDWIRETPKPEQPEGPKKPERKPTTTQPQQRQEHGQTQPRLSTANANVTGNADRIRSALDAIPCSSCDRDEWIKVGMALNSLGWSDGLSMWDAWSRTDTARYKPGECARKWAGFKPGGALDHTYVISLARKHGWTATRTEQPERKAMQEETKPNTKQEEIATEQAQQPSQVDLALSAFETERYKPLSTGVKEIDGIINGGFFSQTLVLVGSHPGAGKTTLCAQLLEGIAKSGKADCVYCNLEMPTTQLIARSLSRMTGIDQLTIMQGYRWTDKQREDIYTAAEQYKNTTQKHFTYLETVTSFYEDILKIFEEKETHREDRSTPFIACIDYIQLLRSNKAKEDVEIIKGSLKAFKDFAINHNAIVIMIMAHSRSVNESGQSKQGAGRDSSSLEYSADLQLSINYSAIIKGNASDKEDMKQKIKTQKLKPEAWEEFTLLCTKNRFGKSSVDSGVDLKMDGEHSRFKVNNEGENSNTAKAKRKVASW